MKKPIPKNLGFFFTSTFSSLIVLGTCCQGSSVRFIKEILTPITSGFLTMLSFAVSELVVLHAGTPVAISQLAITVMFVVLGILLIGFSYSRITKTKDSILQHRWTITSAVILALAVILLVMVPAAFRFYIDPDLMFLEPLSLATLVHSIIGVPAVVTALIYVFGDLPVNVKKWMRIAAVLWLASLALGVIVFLQMLSLI
jgi:uncharacterized membrane protein YozB (DUF420 family)